MAKTYDSIALATIPSGGASSIGFTAIPQTYTDLLIIGSLKTTKTATNDYILGYFNSDTTDGNYSCYFTYTSGASGFTATSAATPSRYFGEIPGNASSVTNQFSATRIYIPDYTSSRTKSYGAETGQLNNSVGASQYTVATTGRWSGTTGITAITFTSGDSANFMEFSTLTLYGILGSN